MEAVAAEHGPWHSHNVHLGHGVWTITPGQRTENSHLRQTLQLVADVARGPLTGLRALDLACEEGAYSIELARLGAEVVGVEGRRENVARARFGAEAIGLYNCDFVEGDVREVTRERYGGFDVVLNVGILYHLDAPDLFGFLERIAAVCDGFMVISTHHARLPLFRRSHRGRRYWGTVFSEHPPSATEAERLTHRRASLDNAASFWLTRASLYNLLADVGFTSVAETAIPCPAPGEAPGNLLNAVAYKGDPVGVPTSSDGVVPRPPRLPELRRPAPHRSQTALGQLHDIARSRGWTERLRRR
jgi:2-polyprenyl-3-methyl-5-hydroxy-6-metoxy-1,4-benzoquinol methylase